MRRVEGLALPAHANRRGVPAGATHDSLYQIAVRKVPVDQFLKKCSNILRAVALMIQVIGVFPHIEREQYLLAVQERGFGVCGGFDLEVPVVPR